MRPHPSPRIKLEQYTIPAEIAADILLLAATVYGDITAKAVADLGTGTGRLATGAALLGARSVMGIDIDPLAIATARGNLEVAGVDVDWVVGDLDAVRGPFDTVVMNPPFGTKKRHADEIFLRKGVSIAPVVYSLHKSTTREHVLRYLRRHGCRVSAIYAYELDIPRMFKYHRRRTYPVKVDCYRIESKAPNGNNGT